MPTRGPFPSIDSELNVYFQNAVPYMVAHAARLNVSAAHSGALNTALANWNNVYPQTSNANTRTKTLIDEKERTKATLTDLMREVFDDIPASALTTADRNTLHLKERAAPTQAPLPTTRPVATVDTSHRLQHTISFTDETTPTSRAKPARMRGCQIWVFVGDAEPADIRDYKFLALDSASPYVAHYESTEAGKKAYYILRWENTRGETGPWSETVMATINA